MLKIGIYGYGNLGRGVEAAVALNDDTELVGVFTRRDPATVKIRTAGVGVYHTDELEKFKDRCSYNLRRKRHGLARNDPRACETFQCYRQF